MGSIPFMSKYGFARIFSDLYKMLWQIILQCFILLYTIWRSLMFCNEWGLHFTNVFHISFLKLISSFILVVWKSLGGLIHCLGLNGKQFLRKKCSWRKWRLKEWFNFNIKTSSVWISFFFFNVYLIMWNFHNCFLIIKKADAFAILYSKILCSAFFYVHTLFLSSNTSLPGLFLYIQHIFFILSNCCFWSLFSHLEAFFNSSDSRWIKEASMDDWCT